MKQSKKEKGKSESSSSSSDSEDSTSSNSDSKRTGNADFVKNSRKRKTSISNKSEQSGSRTGDVEEDISKKPKRDDTHKYKKSRSDVKSNHQDRADRRSNEREERRERYRDKDSEPERNKHERYSDRKKERNDERTKGESERYRKHRNREESDRFDRNRTSRSSNVKEKPREDRERKFFSRDGNRYKNQFKDHRRDNRYGRNRRDRSRSNSFDHANAKWGKSDQDSTKKEKGKPLDKEKPNFGLSGKLTEETNTYRGVVIKYSEPPEARKPKRRWRLYPFKGEKALQTLYIHRESAYLIGRDRKVVDLPVDHPSCSKQHAVLQYRLVSFTRDDGSAGKRVRPYLIDLESANGTYINNKKIDAKKYVELLEKDVIKFGFSSREYVLLHENSKDEIQDDDVKQEEETDIKDEPER